MPTFGRLVNWLWTRGRRLAPLGSILILVLLFVLRHDFAARAPDAMSSWSIAFTFAISLSFASANERLVACWAVRRRRSVSTSALRLSASSGWPEASALNAGDPEREPPRVLASRMFVRTPPGGTYSEGRAFPLLFPLPRCPSAPPGVIAQQAQCQQKRPALEL